MKQILYPKYMFFIASYAVILFTLVGITFAKFIDKLFMDFDKENNVKSQDLGRDANSSSSISNGQLHLKRSN